MLKSCLIVWITYGSTIFWASSYCFINFPLVQCVPLTSKFNQIKQKYYQHVCMWEEAVCTLMRNFKHENEEKPVLEPSYYSFHMVYIKRAWCSTYRVLYFPISAGPIKEIVARLTFHLSLESKTVKINSLTGGNARWNILSIIYDNPLQFVVNFKA